MPPAPVEVAWEVARDRLFRTIDQKGTATAHPELAHSVHVEVDGLEPAREYFYRFRAGRETSQVGRTRTAPAAGAAVDRLRFAVCGCANYEDGYFTAYRRIAEGDFDFVLHTGDYIYEARPNSAPTQPEDPRASRSTKRSAWPTTARDTPSTRRTTTCARPTCRRRS